jgi:hypothetical protein
MTPAAQASVAVESLRATDNPLQSGLFYVYGMDR